MTGDGNIYITYCYVIYHYRYIMQLEDDIFLFTWSQPYFVFITKLPPLRTSIHCEVISANFTSFSLKIITLSSHIYDVTINTNPQGQVTLYYTNTEYTLRIWTWEIATYILCIQKLFFEHFTGFARLVFHSFYFTFH